MGGRGKGGGTGWLPARSLEKGLKIWVRKGPSSGFGWGSNQRGPNNDDDDDDDDEEGATTDVISAGNITWLPQVVVVKYPLGAVALIKS